MAIPSNTALSFGLLEFSFQTAPQLKTDGISSATLEVPLPRNAVVEQFDIVVQAKPASGTFVQNVAQIRANPGTAADNAGQQGMAIVVDFGTPRTVSAVQVPAGLTILRVTPWIGTAFAPAPSYSVTSKTLASGLVSATPGPNSSPTTAILPSEIQTARLLVETLGTATVADLSAQMAVVLPEPPSGLELRIDNGAPVFTHPGPAQAGTDPALTDQGWNNDGERIVKLGDALAKLTGDPTTSQPVTFKLVLSTRVPGVLNIRRNSAAESVMNVRRVVFGSDPSKDFAFAEEGLIQVPLDSFGSGVTVDSAALIREIRFTAAATVPPGRVLPPTGPENASLADLVVKPQRAAMVRLPAGTGLGEITAIRLPVFAEAGGAEARIALWQSKKGGTGEPSDPIPQGTSDSVQLSEAARESWVTFPFKKPVTIDDGLTLWAALLVNRGQVIWPMAVSGGTADPADGNAIRGGAPGGPWLPLPVPFVTRNPDTISSHLVDVRGRVRMAGHGNKDNPIAPFLVALGNGELLPITPTVKGVDVGLHLASPAPLPGARLLVISRVTGTLTIRNLDVVSTK